MLNTMTGGLSAAAAGPGSGFSPYGMPFDLLAIGHDVCSLIKVMTCGAEIMTSSMSAYTIYGSKVFLMRASVQYLCSTLY